MKNKKVKLSLEDIKVQSFAMPVNKNLQQNLFGGATYTCDGTRCATATTLKPGFCTTTCCTSDPEGNCCA